MIKIYCYNWNFKLPPQGIIDSTCGYHAIRNGNMMLDLLNSSNLNYKNYANSITKSSKFKILKSFENSKNEIIKYQKTIKSNSLSKIELNSIIKNNNLNENIFISYCNNAYPMFNINETNKLNNILSKENYRICIIIFKKEFKIAKHWIPIVFDKKGNNVHLHILDSYDMVWWGEQNLNKLVNYFYPNKQVFCINDYKKGGSYYYLTKILHFIILVFAVYLFIFGMFEVKKITRLAETALEKNNFYNM